MRLLRPAVIAAALLLCFQPAVHARPVSRPTTFKYVVDPAWPKPLPHNWILGQVGGVAVDAQDHIWILYRPNSLTVEERGAIEHPRRSNCCVPAPPVIEFDQAGNVLRAWGGPKPGAPYQWPQNEHGIYVDDKGYIYVNGNGPLDGQILKFKPDGTFVHQFGSAGKPTGSQDVTRFGRPAQVRVDPLNNELYVADGYHNHRLIVLDADTGAFHRMWGAYGHAATDPPDCDPTVGSGNNIAEQQIAHCTMYDPSAPPDPQFRTPVDCVWVSKDAVVYVCDRANDRLQLFHKNGAFIREIFYERETRGRGSVWDLYFWPKQTERYIFMPDGENNEIRVYRRSDGALVGRFGRGGHQVGEFEWIHKIAVDSHGNVYAGEVGPGHRVQKFRPVQVPWDAQPSDSDELGIALMLAPAQSDPVLRRQTLQGAMLAIDDINAAGGIPRLAGAHLRLLPSSSASVPKGAIAQINAAVDARTGTAGRPTVDPPAITVEPDLGTQAQRQEIAFLRQLRSRGAVHRAAVLYVDNAFGRTHLRIIERIARAAGIGITAHVQYPTVIADAGPYVSRIRDSKADVVFAVSFVTDPSKKPTPSLMLILKALAQEAHRPLIVGDGAGFTWPSLPKAIGAAVDGIVSTTAWNQDSGPYANAALADRYRARFHTFMPEYAGQSYAAVRDIARALNTIDQPEPKAISAALSRIRVLARPVIVQWRNGVPVTIYPRARQ